MRLLRSTIVIAAITVSVLFAQPAEQTRAKEAALKRSLQTLRQAIDKYTFDQHKAPQTLQDLITKKYVAGIPADPMTGSNSTWRVVIEDPTASVDSKSPGIWDVHSGSDRVSTGGTRYAEW